MKSLQRALAIVVLGIALYSTSVGTLVAQGPQNPGLTSIDRRLIRYNSVTLTNAQVLALNNTAIPLIPAQGAATIIEPLGGIISFGNTAGAPTAYTINGSNKFRLWYTSRVTGPAASNAMASAGVVDQTAAKVENFGGVPSDEILTVNTPIVFQDTTGVAYTSGTATNYLVVRVAYRVHNQSSQY